MKYTVITGASTGIGYEAALAFAGKNKNLIIKFLLSTSFKMSIFFVNNLNLFI